MRNESVFSDMKWCVFILICEMMCASLRAADYLVWSMPLLKKDDISTLVDKTRIQGVLFERLYAPPHERMRYVALIEGVHPFFRGVYGDFPGHQSESVGDPDMKRFMGLIPFMGDLDSFLKGDISSHFILGENWAWGIFPSAESRIETRPIAIEDVGATLGLLIGKKEMGIKSVEGMGRDIRSSGEWLPLITHYGRWVKDVSIDKMKFSGGFVWSDQGEFLLDHLDDIEKFSDNDKMRFMVIMRYYLNWWNTALMKLTQAHHYKIEPRLGNKIYFQPNQWRQSVIDRLLEYVPSHAAWTEDVLAEMFSLNQRRGWGGSFPVEISQEGHYEIVASLSLEGIENPLLMKKGKLLLQCGAVHYKMDILEGAQSIRVALDLMAGRDFLEVNILEEGAEKSYSLPYISIEYKGEKKAPVIKFPGQS